jgi:hypothetical protein
MTSRREIEDRKTPMPKSDACVWVQPGARTVRTAMHKTIAHPHQGGFSIREVETSRVKKSYNSTHQLNRIMTNP